MRMILELSVNQTTKTGITISWLKVKNAKDPELKKFKTCNMLSKCYSKKIKLLIVLK